MGKVSVIHRGQDGQKVPIKMWNQYVPAFEDKAIEQLVQIASMPFVKPWVAAMPDTHLGIGATVGSVIPTQGAVMPAAVGVDIGCGMIAVRTNLKSPVGIPGKENVLQESFEAISKAVPHGRTNDGGVGDRGAWGDIPGDILDIWEEEFEPHIYTQTNTLTAFERHPKSLSMNAVKQLGTLGTGNHFIELAVEIDNPDSKIWVVLHSGSRGFGNKIGSYYTRLARDLNEKHFIQLPNRDLGYLVEGTQEFNDYTMSVSVAQAFAWRSREIMVSRVLKAIGAQEDTNFVYAPTQNAIPVEGLDPGEVYVPSRIHMHHNYMDKTFIKGIPTLLTRKGAVKADYGDWVIIPGSMGAKTYLGVGTGNPESFHSCSHGAGRAMSRTQALHTFSVDQHIAATQGVYCDKTRGTLDETPAAYKNIDDVMASQSDLVTPILSLKQIVSVKGISQ